MVPLTEEVLLQEQQKAENMLQTMTAGPAQGTPAAPPLAPAAAEPSQVTLNLISLSL